MIRALILTLALVLPSLASASGPYDGIWKAISEGEGYLTFHELNNAIIAIGHDLDDRSWEAFDGTREGNRMILSMIYGLGQGRIQVTFRSETEGSVTILSCSSELGSFCNFNAGDSFNIVKAF